MFSVFQNWLINREELDKPILKKIEKPRGRQRKRLPTRSETAQILMRAKRDFYLIYSALRQTGARPMELCGAQISQWDQERGLLVLEEHKTSEETGRPREIAVGKKVEKLFRRSIGNRTSGPIFRTNRRHPWTPRNLSARYRALRKKAKLADELVLYLTRHEHGTQLADKFGIHAAAQALGHASITTTERYIKTDAEKLKARQDGVGDG